MDENSTLPAVNQVALVVYGRLTNGLRSRNYEMVDDLWLNESFANMMEYVCVDAIE